jgi:hypothetical protein
MMIKAVARSITVAAYAGGLLWQAVPGDARAQAADPACAAVDESDLAALAGCMSLEQLAGQLSAFNQHIGQRITGRSLEENIEAADRLFRRLGHRR